MTLVRVTPTLVTVPPTPIHALHVTGISGVTHTRKGITTITVGFDKSLDPSSAMKPAFYRLAPVKKGLIFSGGVRVGGVTYNGADPSVTVRLARPTKGRIRVIVRGGIRAADGTVSFGDFTAVVSRVRFGDCLVGKGLWRWSPSRDAEATARNRGFRMRVPPKGSRQFREALAGVPLSPRGAQRDPGL
jgi:hypothetical protein